jgi:carboxylesterase type B
VPVLASRALWEGRVFSNPGVTTNESFHADLRALLPNGNDDFFARLTKLYPGKDYFHRRFELLGDYFVNCPTAWLLAAVSKKNMPAYKLIFKAGDENHGAESRYIYRDNRTYKIMQSGLALILVLLLRSTFRS